MPYTKGVDEARHYIEEAMKDEQSRGNNIRDELDPEQEKEIVECKDNEDQLHPDFLQVNPDELEIENNMTQIRRTFKNIEYKTADAILEEARNLDKFQKKALHVAINYVQYLTINI